MVAGEQRVRVTLGCSHRAKVPAQGVGEPARKRDQTNDWMKQIKKHEPADSHDTHDELFHSKPPAIQGAVQVIARGLPSISSREVLKKQ